MTDRELLELAAKAAGIEIDPIDAQHEPQDWVAWNPLTDDGDALRLAVKLKMTVDTDFDGGAIAGNANIVIDEPEYGYQEGMGKKDPYAAARRAMGVRTGLLDEMVAATAALAAYAEASPAAFAPPFAEAALAAARDGAAAEARPLAYRLGIDAALDRLLIAGADTASLNGWDIPQFPLKGGEIVARGIKAGPEVARVLRQVEAGWMAAGFADSVIPALLEAELREQA